MCQIINDGPATYNFYASRSAPCKVKHLNTCYVIHGNDVECAV